MLKLGYVGNIEGLHEYLELQTFSCKVCKDEGVIMKDEWTGTDTNYEVAVRCECSLD